MTRIGAALHRTTLGLLTALALPAPTHAAPPEALWTVPAIAGIATLVAWVALSARAARALARASSHATAAASSAGHVPAPGDAVAVWRASVGALEALAADRERESQEEFRRLAIVREQVAGNDGLYRLAVDRAGDGMWEWDLRAGKIAFSARWWSMLGHAASQTPEDAGRWEQSLHPEERSRVMEAIREHLEGRSARVELEHRLRHRDGSYRRVLTSAHAMRHASGAPYRLIGLNIDITARWQVCEVLTDAAGELAELDGIACYRALIARFARAVDMQEVFLCECVDHPPSRVRMLAHWRDGEFVDCKEFNLAGTPCKEVIEGPRVVYVPKEMAARWPVERPRGTEAYLGVPCLDSRGLVIGHIACKQRRAMRPELPHEAVMRLFAMRAAMEMERRSLDHLASSAETWEAPEH